MFSVVNAADGFVPQDVGKALASLWALNGLTMKLERLESSDLICPFTLDKINNAGMTADGHLYQLGFIMDWLRSNSSSPLTNLALSHNNILRVSDLFTCVAHVLDVKGCQVIYCFTLSGISGDWA